MGSNEDTVDLFIYLGSLHNVQWEYVFAGFVSISLTLYLLLCIYLWLHSRYRSADYDDADIQLLQEQPHQGVSSGSVRDSLLRNAHQSFCSFVAFFDSSFRLRTTELYPLLSTVLGREEDQTFSSQWFSDMQIIVSQHLRIRLRVVACLVLVSVSVTVLPLAFQAYAVGILIGFSNIPLWAVSLWAHRISRLKSLDSHLSSHFFPPYVRSKTRYTPSLLISRVYMEFFIEGQQSFPCYCWPVPAGKSEIQRVPFAGLRDRITDYEWERLTNAISVRYHGTKDRKRHYRLQEIVDLLNAYFMPRDLYFAIGYILPAKQHVLERLFRRLFGLIPKLRYSHAVLCIEDCSFGIDPHSYLPPVVKNPALDPQKLHKYAALYSAPDDLSRRLHNKSVEMPFSKTRLFPTYYEEDRESFSDYILFLVGPLFNWIVHQIHERVSLGGKEHRLMDSKTEQQSFLIVCYSLLAFCCTMGICVTLGVVFGWTFSIAFFAFVVHQFFMHRIAVSHHSACLLGIRFSLSATEDNAVRWLVLGVLSGVFYGIAKHQLDNASLLLLLMFFFFFWSLMSLGMVRFINRYFLNRRYVDPLLFTSDTKLLFGASTSSCTASITLSSSAISVV
eukprot:ANDGO_07145.mRNA.1 hypothetical protein